MVFDKLGCPQWRVAITQRGGRGQRIEFPFQSFDFDRTLNSFTNANVLLPTSPEMRSRCCDLLNGMPTRLGDVEVPEIDVWSHELNIFAQGVPEPQWSGPLFNMKFNQRVARLNGRDVFQWFERRYLHTHDRNLHSDLANNFRIVVDDAMELDDSPSISVSAKPTGITQTLVVKSVDWPRAADLLRTITGAGLDFTVVGRHIYIGGVEILFPDELQVWDPMAEMVDYERRGSELATQYGFTGEIREVDRVSVSVGGTDGRYGLLELHETDLDIKDDETALAAATSRWDFVKKPPNYVTAELNEEGPHVKHLVPGMYCDVRLSGRKLGCRHVKEVMRLQSVKVSGDNEQKTKVGLTLVPVGRTSES